jgi:hypothetical protein
MQLTGDLEVSLDAMMSDYRMGEYESVPQANTAGKRLIIALEDFSPDEEFTWVSVERLSKDLKSAAAELTREDVRALVDLFYDQQSQRIRINNQIKAASKEKRSHDLLDWALRNQKLYEANCQAMLSTWGMEYPVVSEWAKKIYGVGPIICAGMLAHLNEVPPQTAGHWWSFAGIIPGLKKEKGKRRPWNATLKTLLWKFATVQVRLYSRNPENCHYGALYYTRKAYEQGENLSGALSPQAVLALSEKNYSKTTDAYKWYSGCYTAETYADYLNLNADYAKQREAAEDKKEREKLSAALTKDIDELLKSRCLKEGEGLQMLPPAHIHARSLRWIEKMFLSHWHHVAYELHFKKLSPRPWVIENKGHTHFIPPPCWDDPYA